MKGLVFSIEEFSVYDGPGIRTAVFFKGCPLRCNWCHNPEGLAPARQIVKNPNGCTGCGCCRAACAHPDGCTLCGKCVAACPKNLIRISGTEWEADELVRKLSKNIDILNESGGGITFSGGECLMQADFLTEVIEGLKGKTHLAVQTSGYGQSQKFLRIAESVDLVMFDLKVMDRKLSKKYIGKDNDLILHNFQLLKDLGVPYIARVPLIPGVTDTEENLRAIADAVGGEGFVTVELLPYNKMAGSKYKLVGLEYCPSFDTAREPDINTLIFSDRGINVKVY